MARNFKKLPRIALAGRRNVGKSTLLNAMYGRRRAITDSFAGLTRDILEVEVNKAPYSFLLSDTPGLDIENPEKLESDIIKRAFEYIQSVDLILFLLEAPAPSPFDHEFIDLFRKKNISTPVLYVINKIDGAEKQIDGMSEFYALGLNPIIPVSAKARWNLDELLESISDLCPDVKNSDINLEELAQIKNQASRKHKYKKTNRASKLDFKNTEDINEKPTEVDLSTDEDVCDNNNENEYIEYDFIDTNEKNKLDSKHKTKANIDVNIDSETNAPAVRSVTSVYASNKDINIETSSSVISDSRVSETRIALVGKPNAGKSSIFNRLTNQDLALVSEVPGTTRDTMDTVFQYKGSAIRIVDTAGLRRAGKYLGKDSVEFYSAARTKRAIRDARVVIHIIDTIAGVTDYDKKISAQIRELHRPVILAFNKWDAVSQKHNHSIRDYLDRFHFLFPQIQNMPYVFCSALSGKRISQLMDLGLKLDKKMKTRISTGVLNQNVKSWLKQGPTSSRDLRVFYVSQVETEPPAFVFFVNRKKLFRENLRLFLENKIRKNYGLEGIPLDLLIRERKKEEKPTI